MISSFSSVKYILGNQKYIIEKSNVVEIKLINEIINFEKKYCNSKIEIVIKNTSGVIINNIKYLDYCICNNSVQVFKGKANVDYYKCNQVVVLGDLKPSEEIIIRYNTKTNKKNCSLLTYNIMINKILNKIYIECD